MPMTSEAPSFSVVGPSATRSGRDGRHHFRGHDDYIYAVCYSPDGSQIATGGKDDCIRIWDSNTGEMLIVTGYYSGTVNSLCYSPDGKRLVSGDDGGRICISNTSDGRLLKHVRANSSVRTITYSLHGQHIASGGSDGSVCIWDAEDITHTTPKFCDHPDQVTSVSFSPDGRRLVTGCCDSKIRIFAIATGALVVPPLEGHTDAVWTVVFNPNGMQLASCSADCTIRIWDASTGALLLGPLEGHFDAVRCLAYSPDGRRLVSGSCDKTIRVWHSDSGMLIGGPVRGHEHAVAAVSFAPDGTRFVTGASDASMRVWDARRLDIVSFELTEDEKERYELTGPFRGHTGEITAVGYLDGDRVASASSDGTIRIWDVHTGEQVGRPLISRWVRSIAVSSDGSRLVAGGSGIRVWDSRSGRLVLGPLKGQLLISCVQFSPDDQIIASADDAGHIFLWDAQTGNQFRSIQGHYGWINALSFSRDGRRLASGAADKLIRIWDVSAMKMVAGPFKGHTDWVRSVAFSPDGCRIVSGSDDSTLRVWDAQTAKLLFAPVRAHTGRITSVSYSPDGARICSTAYDGTVCLWNVMANDLVLGLLQGHKGAIRSAAFSPNGDRIVTGSTYCTIKFWDVATGKIIQFPKRPTEFQVTYPHGRSKLLVEGLARPLDLTEKIQRLEDHCCAGGGFADVYKCLYDSPSGTVEVAVKALRFSMTSGGDVDKSEQTEQSMLSKPVHRELGIWRRLEHQNVVPFLGIASGFGPHISLVSLWMSNGTLQTFLEKYDDWLSIIDRFSLLQDIVSGLEYLHYCSMVHGDLTPSNILIDGDFRARLTDFGFSSAIGTLPSCLAYLQRSTQRPGAIRWAAPEKLLQESDGTSQLTTNSDIYSFGCIMLQVLSGKQPWSGCNDMMILRCILDGTKHPRPSSHPIDDQHWTFIQQCMSSATERPSTEQAVALITRIFTSLSSSMSAPFSAVAKQNDTSFKQVVAMVEQASMASGSLTRNVEGLKQPVDRKWKFKWPQNFAGMSK